MLSSDKMLHLHRVTNSIDIRHRGLHPIVHRDATLDAKLQPCLFRQLRVWCDADGQNHQLRLQRLCSFEQDPDAAGRLLKAFHSMAQQQTDAFFPHFCVNEGCHLRVKGVHELLRALDHSDLHPQFPQILSHLQTDEAAASQHYGPGVMGFHKFVNPQGILHRAQGEHLPNAGQLRLGGLRAGRE